MLLSRSSARTTARRMASTGARSPGPDFPLRGALRDEHFDAGNGFDAALGRKLQQLGLARAINGVKYEPAIQFVRVERRTP